ncbi:MAG: hypothetical protein CSA62_01875 [Planctomycetota bacterium]|nr:MAG: hypothetical protein CSA62_01875 [Planctomycetota bacterium]
MLTGASVGAQRPTPRKGPAPRKALPRGGQAQDGSKKARERNLQELDDSELYFEAYYRRYFQLDTPAALKAFELLSQRRDSRFQRLAQVRLIEIYRDTLRYDQLAAILMRIRQDRKNGLSGAQRSQLRAWAREIKRHKAALDSKVTKACRSIEHKSGRKPTASQIERLRLDLSVQLIRKNGKKLQALLFGSRFFATALLPYTGREPNARAALRDKRDKKRRRKPGHKRPDQSQFQWHKAMVHRLAQKRQLRKGNGRKELLRLYDDRIRRHLCEMGKIHLQQMRQASKPRRDAMLRHLRKRFAAVAQGLSSKERSVLEKIRRPLLKGLEQSDWKAVEEQLKTAIDKHPSLLRRFFTTG